MKYLLILFCFLFLNACNNAGDPGKILADNNFDGLEGWGFSHPTLTSERSYSGKYSVKIDASNEFSIGFDQILGTITNKKPKRILVELRAYIPSETAKARFVCSIEDPKTKQNKFRQDFNLIDKTSDYREWVKITKRLELPDNIQLSDKFTCYLWRPEPSDQPVYMDDLKITVLK